MNGEDGKSCSWLKWGMRLTWHKLRDGFKDNDWSSFLWLESWLPFPGLQSPLLVLLSVTPDSILESLPGKEWQTRSWVIEEKKKKNKISIGLLWVTSAGSLFSAGQPLLQSLTGYLISLLLLQSMYTTTLVLDDLLPDLFVVSNGSLSIIWHLMMNCCRVHSSVTEGKQVIGLEKRQKFNRKTKSPLSVSWQQIRGENCRGDDVLFGLDVVVVVCSLKLSREREKLSWRRRQKPNLGSRSEAKQRKKWWETSQWEGEMLPQNCLSLLFRVSASVTGTKFTNSTSSHGRQMKLNLISRHGMSKIFVIFRGKEFCFFKSNDKDEKQEGETIKNTLVFPSRSHFWENLCLWKTRRWWSSRSLTGRWDILFRFLLCQKRQECQVWTVSSSSDVT